MFISILILFSSHGTYSYVVATYLEFCINFLKYITNYVPIYQCIPKYTYVLES